MSNSLITPHGDIVLVLTLAEAEGLRACADEGAEGLFADKESLKAYVGPPAAQRAAERALAELASVIYRRKRG